MCRLPSGIKPIVINEGRKVYDFVCETGQTLITSYCRLNKKVMAENNIEIYLSGNQNRTEVTSIDELKEALKVCISASINILSKHTPYAAYIDPYTYPDFSHLNKDLLEQQLVFDVLFDKYLDESELMTRSGYATKMSEFLEKNKYSCSGSINEGLRRGMENYHDMVKYSQLREQVEALGVDPDKYAQYYTSNVKENSSKKKPEFVWDCLYFNYALSICSRQYRRQLTREGRNYSYEEIVRGLNDYNKFVKSLLPEEHESPKNYYRMSMDYYVLEVYKRNDFSFKLIDLLKKMGTLKFSHDFFLVRRFVPLVLVPYIYNSELQFRYIYRYYRPLFVIEEEMHEEMQKQSSINQKFFDNQLLKYHYVRAKAYELFKYHMKFVSSDYSDIKKFLCDFYDMRLYHQSTGIWKIVEKGWKDMQEETKRQVKEQIRIYLSINDALFWKSTNREVNLTEN